MILRVILLYCVFITNGMCSNVDFDQFKTEILTQFESMKTQFESMKNQIERLKDGEYECKIKPQDLKEELRNQRGQIFL